MSLFQIPYNYSHSKFPKNITRLESPDALLGVALHDTAKSFNSILKFRIELFHFFPSLTNLTQSISPTEKWVMAKGKIVVNVLLLR